MSNTETTQPEWLAAWTAFERDTIASWDCASELSDLKEVFRKGWNAGVLAAVNDKTEREACRDILRRWIDCGSLSGAGLARLIEDTESAV